MEEGHLVRLLIDVHVEPPVTWGDDHLLRSSVAARNVLWDPRRYLKGAQVRVLLNLLNERCDLVEWSTVSRWETTECSSVRAWAEISRLKPALCALFGGNPSGPPAAAKLFHILKRLRTIQKCAEFTDSHLKLRAALLSWRDQVALGDDRESIFDGKPHHAADHHSGGMSLLRGYRFSAILDVSEEILVLKIGRSFMKGKIWNMHACILICQRAMVCEFMALRQ
jgi:hypothetical protein